MLGLQLRFFLKFSKILGQGKGSEGWAKSKSKAKEHTPVDSEFWAEATAEAFDMLLQVVQEEYGEVTKPEWWNDESPKALSKSGLGL